MYATVRFRRHVTIIVVSVLSLVITVNGTSAQNEIAPADKAAIARVQTGETAVAHASWWGFNRQDATKSLQAALNSRAKRVIIDKLENPWIITPIELPGDKEIVFESGVIIEAKRGAFRGSSDCLFVARGKKNLKLTSTDATLRMHKSDYHKPPYKAAEWRHALSLRGCENVIVEGLTLQDSGGDGIYLGTGTGGAPNRNITVRNVVCDGNNRQGISVITAENLLIENCIFRNTRGTAPEAGIDFEPNRPEEQLVNCVVRNCRSEHNAGHAYLLYLGHMNRDSKPVSILFEHCTSKDCERYSTYVGVANRSGNRSVTGSIEFIDCQFNGDKRAGVFVHGNEADGCHVTFDKCAITRPASETKQPAALIITAPPNPQLDGGNITIRNCVIRDSIARKPIAINTSPLTRIRNLSGSLAYHSPDGVEQFTLDDRQLTAWFPQLNIARRIQPYAFDWRRAELANINRPRVPATDGAVASSFRLRNQAALLISCTTDRSVKLVAQIERVSRASTSTGTMTITTPGGESTLLTPVRNGDQVTYSFTSADNGTYRLQWQGHSGITLRITQCSMPFALYGKPAGIHLFRPTGRLYVFVPTRVKEFALQVTGAGTAETVKVTVRDDSGQVVGTRDNIAIPYVFLLKRASAQTPGIWSIDLERATTGVLEDVSLQVLGIPSVFATSPQNLFTPSHELRQE